MTDTVLKAAVAAAIVASGSLAVTTALADGPRPIELRKLASVQTSNAADPTTAAEIVAYDARTQRAFAINSDQNELAIIDLSKVSTGVAPVIGKLSFAAYGNGLNSVAVHEGLVAVAVEASPKTAPGKVVLFRASANDLSAAVDYTVGALPDMLTFARNGRYLLVANEGEPNSYNRADSVDPVGSISILDLRRGPARATVATAGFAGFDSQLAALRAQGVRIFGPNASVAQDLEPEYITTHGDTAWVTLQEANAVAVVDIPSATVTSIVPLGLKDHSLPGNGLDASDREISGAQGAINIRNWPVFGMYQPDAIASFVAPDGQVYLVTANEGDARDWPGFSDEIRVGASGYRLDADVFPNSATLKTNANLGRLNVTTQGGNLDADPEFERIQAFGARSISVWNASGQLVWDSGDALERITAERFPALFNADNALAAPPPPPPAAAPTTFDTRSDNKGPEPEGVAVGKYAGRTYAFVGLERIGGLMAWDVTDPAAPVFAAYANERSAVRAEDALLDRGAEGIEFVRESDSPTCNPLVLVGNETSRTVSVFEVVRTDREGRRTGCEKGRARN